MAKYLTTNSTARILPSMNSETKRPMQATIYIWITNCQKQNAYVSVLIFYVGILFLFWIYGCWRSSAKWASHLNLDEWTVKHYNAQLLPDCECLTSNNRSDSEYCVRLALSDAEPRFQKLVEAKWRWALLNKSSGLLCCLNQKWTLKLVGLQLLLQIEHSNDFGSQKKRVEKLWASH